MDLNQKSGRNDNNGYRNKLYCIITFSRNIYLYCDEFFRLYLIGFSQHCHQYPASNSGSPDCWQHHTTHL